MSNSHKDKFLGELRSRFDGVTPIPGSHSLFDIEEGQARIYIRYSKIHSRNKSFYGLRKKDLKTLEGRNSFICFIWEEFNEPIFVDYAAFEETFADLTPASDGQFKAHIFHQPNLMELRLGAAGKFNIEGFLGWSRLESAVESSGNKRPVLTHPQIQTLIGAIGAGKGFSVWIPPSDIHSLDWNIAPKFAPLKKLPTIHESVDRIANEIDVMWIQRGDGMPDTVFEVEHTTPIYSGLLRFNDVLLALKNRSPRFSITADRSRRSKFYREIRRPSFVASGLSDLCSFLDYDDVWRWHGRANEQLNGRI